MRRRLRRIGGLIVWRGEGAAQFAKPTLPNSGEPLVYAIDAEGIRGLIGMQAAGEAYPYDSGGKDQPFPHSRYRYTLT